MNSIFKLLRHLSVVLLMITSLGSQAGLLEDLKDGQHVLLMRHADAPGYGDPIGYQLNQCPTQRNLGDYGIKQSKLIGQWLSSQGINTALVLSSPWCRCIDTAKLLDKGPVSLSPELGSFFDNMSLEKKQTRELAALIKSKLSTSKNLPIIMVTHHVNIEAFTGKAPNVGDMLLVKVNKDGYYLSHRLYPSPTP
jgi:phosphohistidine phosphatase SixA